MKNVTLIYGDGIGKEVMSSAVEVIKATGADINFEEEIAGLEAVEKYGEPLPKKVIDSIKKNKVALKGPVTTPVGKGFRSVNVTLRKELNLYANVRPVKTYEGLKNRYEDIDLVIIRENTEGLYAGIEKEIEGGAETTRLITKEASKRIAKYAFELAKRENRKMVTALHKANICKLTDRVFLDAVNEVHKDYPEIELNDLIIDAACMNLVMYPEKYDVLLATNLFGDIVSDLCAGLIGGLGLTTGSNIGEDGAIFEAVHGSAPDIAGKDIANPTACILAGAKMLNYIGYEKEAKKIENAIEVLIKEGKYLTKDLGGNLGTKEFTKRVIERLQ
ncbi:isocitrate/isopropylmalate dehydrogenase family protein [Anaerofustis stercorihominis]|uniref:isocitrate/isopropylmalate dehydrogenase family protein n=1 Tax=Anaerofustis stercorihominis TaxID=214853 RepID=UPI00210A3DBF|nr:isocitrate/isopropylmalate dehydrogenase family protein [Anaerofustis stercorihominis]MCQ4795455.1 isocitrate/isopropylmalate dehydrogenase family protein [Anaerofustis stercorihominis]